MMMVLLEQFSLLDLGYPDFADRGTGYNYFDGNHWGPYPTVRIEVVPERREQDGHPIQLGVRMVKSMLHIIQEPQAELEDWLLQKEQTKEPVHGNFLIFTARNLQQNIYGRSMTTSRC